MSESEFSPHDKFVVFNAIYRYHAGDIKRVLKEYKKVVKALNKK